MERKAEIVLQRPTDIAEQLQKWIVLKQGSGAIPPLPLDAEMGLSREEQTGHFERALLENRDGEDAHKLMQWTL